MCEAGVNIKAMQDILGHADAVTTMNIYADATSDLKEREMKNFAQFFTSMKGKKEAAPDDKTYDQTYDHMGVYDQLTTGFTTNARPTAWIYDGLYICDAQDIV